MPAAPLAGRDVGEFVELAPRMGEAGSFGHGPRRSAELLEPVVSGKGVGLQDAGVAPQMTERYLAYFNTGRSFCPATRLRS